MYIYMHACMQGLQQDIYSYSLIEQPVGNFGEPKNFCEPTKMPHSNRNPHMRARRAPP